MTTLVKCQGRNKLGDTKGQISSCVEFKSEALVRLNALHFAAIETINQPSFNVLGANREPTDNQSMSSEV